MTLVNYALTTVAKTKVYMGISSTDTSQDSVIEQTINGISSYIQRYCGRNFLNQQYVEYRDGESKAVMTLYNYPVTAFTTFEYRSGTPSQPIWNTYYVDSYIVYLLGGYLKFFGKLSDIPLGYRATYTAGYLINFANETDPAQHNLPEDLTQTCMEIVARTINNEDGILRETTEGQMVIFDTMHGLNDGQKAILNSYKVQRV